MLLVLVLAATGALGQNLPQGGPMPMPQAPVVPDTAIADLELPAGAAGPDRWTATPDTVVFGATVTLVPAGGEAPAGLTTETDWLVPVEGGEPGFLDRLLGRGSEAPEVPTFRVYRTDPFRLAVGDWVSGVIHVTGRTASADEVATVRTPPFPGLPWGRLFLLALAVGLLVFLVIWLWDRRRGPMVWPDREIRGTAWLDTAPGLHELLTGGALARGEGRVFLDGLAGLARRYVGGRYGIAATEMTGREMVAACRRLGYPLAPVKTLAGLVDDADRHRYDPEPPTPAWCRERAVAFYSGVHETRVAPAPATASPERVREAERAWTAVARELDPTGRLMAADRGGGE